MRVKGLLGVAVLAAAALILVFLPRREPPPPTPGPSSVSPRETPAAAPPAPAPTLVGPPTVPAAETAPSPLPPPAPEARWSAWSEPVQGLSCRAFLPGRAPRGERLTVTVEFRVDPLLLPEGKKYISLREDQGSLILRRRNAGESEPVSIGYGSEKILETPALEEEGVEAPPMTELERHPDWIPLADAVGKPREFRFTLARAWDALAPGEWEARFEIDAFSTGESPSLWSGTLASPPVPLVIEEPPFRRIHALVPSQLRVRPGAVRGTVAIGFGEGDGDFVDIEPRNGFRLGWQSGTDEFSTFGVLEEEWEGFEFGTEFGGETGGGSLDFTLAVEIFEVLVDAEVPFLDLPLPGANTRTLWKKSFRVTATAAEIEALRR